MKKLLFITEGFYEYDSQIKGAIEKMGYAVRMFQARIELTACEKLVHKMHLKKYIAKRQKKEQTALLEGELYDVVLVICGHSLDVELFSKLRRRQKGAKFLLYLWDDIGRVRNYEAIKHHFDRIITSDRQDAHSYHLEFRPLFFVPDYQWSGRKKCYELCFIGWSHSDRKIVVEQILKNNYNNGEKVFIHLLAGRMLRWRAWLAEKFGKKSACAGYLTSEKLSTGQAAEILVSSRAALDVQHPSQKGLTIRTIECLAAHTKLITTNPEVRYYNFYHESNIQVIDRKHPAVDRKRLEEPWVEVSGPVISRYSLEQWASDVLNGNIEQDFLKDDVVYGTEAQLENIL